MTRRLALVLAFAVIVAGSFGLAAGKACPPTSHNPQGTPPNCGHGPAQPGGTCTTGGLAGDGTIANRVFGTQNEDGPISKGLHSNEGQFQDLGVVVHEGSCVGAAAEDLLGQ